MKISTLVAAAAVVFLAGAASASSSYGPGGTPAGFSSSSRSLKQSTVVTIRNDGVASHWVGKSLVGSFTQNASSVQGGVGKSFVRTVTRSENTVAARGKTSVLSVTRSGSHYAGSVASFSGSENFRREKKKN